jgi:CRISPR/Cas system Type II protein with McrA/HNH and RuvC-like nuclease domain
MFHCENDLLANLIVLNSSGARKRFRESIFESWNWQCAYCDEELCSNSATLDHVVPKHKGGQNVRSNLVCACASCNRNKGSQNVFEYMNFCHQHYSEERVGKLREWMEQKPHLAIVLPSIKSTPCFCNNASPEWVATCS